VAFENPPPDHDPFREEVEKVARRARRRGLGPKPDDPAARSAWYAERGRRNRRLAAWGTAAAVVLGVAHSVGALWASDARREREARDAWRAWEQRDRVTYAVSAYAGAGLATFEGYFATRTLPWPPFASAESAGSWEDLKGLWMKGVRAGPWERVRLRTHGPFEHRALVEDALRDAAVSAGLEFVVEGA
jgi:hypothetical protein